MLISNCVIEDESKRVVVVVVALLINQMKYNDLFNYTWQGRIMESR